MEESLALYIGVELVFLYNALDQVAVERLRRVSVTKPLSPLIAALVMVQNAAWTLCLADAHQGWRHWVLRAESGICLHPLLCAFPVCMAVR